MWIKPRHVAGLSCCLLAGAVHAGGFLEDSKTALRYSQFYWKENDGGGIGPTRDEWVQGAQLSFNSGWYRDMLGVDYSYGLANDLNIGSDATSLSNLEKGDSVQSPHGLAKPIEAYLRGKYAGSAGELSLGAGKKIRRFAQYRDDTTRILPAATVGFDLGYHLDALDLRYSRINAFSPRQENGWGDDLSNFRGEQIDNLDLYAFAYKLPFGTGLQAEYAESTDYLREAMVKVEHSFNLGGGRGLDLYATTGMQEDAGKLFEYSGVRGLYEAEDSHDARYIDLSAKLRSSNYYAGIAYNKVWGDDFDRLFFAKDHGTWNSSAKLFYYFGLENEEMVRLSGGMSFADIGIPQLRLDAYYAFSSHAAGYDDFSRKDFQTVLQYNFDGVLKGLSAVWLHEEFDTDGTPDGVSRQVATFGPAGIITHDAERIYLNYVYNF